MHTRAAVLWEAGSPWSIEELEVDEPRPGEVLVKMDYAGLCHTDDHAVSGEYSKPTPYVGGHEGSGTVIGVGSAVDRVEVGDQVLLVPTPSCASCRYCASGRQYLCRRRTVNASRDDGTHQFVSGDGRGVGAYSKLGTFSEYTVVEQSYVFRRPDSMPGPVAAVISCAVLTGYGSSVHAADVQPGDVVVVVGAGGIGLSAIMGAKVAGAAVVVAVDLNESKVKRALSMGATHGATSLDEAREVVAGVSGGAMADSVVVAVGLLRGNMIGAMAALTAPGGCVVLASVADAREDTVHLPLNDFALTGKRLVGTLLGNCSPAVDVPRLFALYEAGALDLDGLITASYPLDEISQGYADLLRGENLRGIIDFSK